MKLKNKFQTIESSNSEIRDNEVIRSQFNSFFKLSFYLN